MADDSMDPGVHFGVFQAALVAADQNALDADQLSTVLPDHFVIPYPTPRFTDPIEDGSLYGAMRSRRGWLLVLRGSGQSVGECREVLFQSRRAVEGRRFQVGETWTSPLAVDDPSVLPERDDLGYYTASIQLNYSLEDQ